MPNPYTVVLTGGIGSGKSLAAEMFAALGVTVIDADAIAHALTQSGGAAMPAIRAAFGDAVIDASGALDRAAMRQRAFADGAVRQRLEAILHPLIRTESQAQLARAASPYAVLVIPLYFEAAQRRPADRVLVIDCAEEVQLRRVMARSRLNVEEVKRIMAAQVSRATRLAGADDVVLNEATEEDLRRAVERLHTQYRGLAATHNKGSVTGPGGL